jgi:hypothetical protein
MLGCKTEGTEAYFKLTQPVYREWLNGAYPCRDGKHVGKRRTWSELKSSEQTKNIGGE